MVSTVPGLARVFGAEGDGKSGPESMASESPFQPRGLRQSHITTEILSENPLPVDLDRLVYFRTMISATCHIHIFIHCHKEKEKSRSNISSIPMR